MSDVRDNSEDSTSATIDKLDETNGHHIEPTEVEESEELLTNEQEESMHDSITSAEDAKFDKLDELTSLEREIAELHHVEPTAPSVAQKVKDGGAATLTHDEYQRDAVLLEMQPMHKKTASSYGNSEHHHHMLASAGNSSLAQRMHDDVHEPLEEEDLIAVLKGVVDNDNKTEQQQLMDEDNDVAVTIEGEGEFEIMEIDDDDIEECVEMNVAEPAAAATTSVSHVTTNSYVSSSATKLTKEEERNLAMEQIQCLKNRKEHSKKQNLDQQAKNRRKQDIKTLPVESSDIVSLLGADWSEDEVTADPLEPSSAAASAATVTSTTISPKDVKPFAIPLAKLPARPSVSTASGNAAAAAAAKDKLSDKAKRRNSPPKITSVVLLKSGNTAAAESKTDEAKNAEVEQKKKEAEATAAPVPQTTGFKRTRIIKRKIIWDPDAPETTFSYAQLVRPSNVQPTPPKVKSEPVKNVTSAASGKSAAAPSTILLQKKNQEAAKKIRPITPKDKKLLTQADAPAGGTTAEITLKRPKILIKSSTSTTTLTALTPKDSNAATAKQQARSPTDSNSSAGSPNKRRSQTPVANGANKKKKISEIDRLMGDEGAINMLNSLENERQKKANELSELPKSNMRSRSATISEKFVKRDLTPSRKDSSAAAAPKPKRVVKPKASASWDYVYKQQASEDAMIIRRRSNSSYSSSASVTRLSLDALPANSTKGGQKPPPKGASKATLAAIAAAANQATSSTDDEAGDGAPKTNNSGTTSSTTVKAFEFAKPESKTQQKVRKTKSPQAINPLSLDIKKSNTTSVNNKRIVRSPATVEGEKEKSATKSPITVGKDDAHTAQGITVRKIGKVAQIIFNTNKAKIENTFSLELLNNFIETLSKLEADSDCHAVAVTTNSANFCQGLDISELAAGSLEKRKKVASQLGDAVKKFLKTLATFSKPIIAGVNGANVGLGVMMLPFFDIIIASDKGSYETPYAKIGQTPEGYCLWNANNKIRGTFKTKLFWLCEKLHSTESALSGLVNKLTTPNKVNDDAVATAKRLASFSEETYRTMKKTSIDAIEEVVTVDLEQEFETIIEQWSSEECFENFKKFTQTGHW